MQRLFYQVNMVTQYNYCGIYPSMINLSPQLQDVPQSRLHNDNETHNIYEVLASRLSEIELLADDYINAETMICA